MTATDEMFVQQYRRLTHSANELIGTISAETEKVSEMGKRTLRPGSPILTASNELVTIAAEYDMLFRNLFDHHHQVKHNIRTLLDGPAPPRDVGQKTEEDPQP